MTDPITRRTYLPGSWFGIFGGSATVLLPPSEKARVGGLWALIDDGAGFDEVLDALISTGLRDLPGFVLVSELDGATQVVVRGAARAEFDTDQGLVEIAGSSATTWVEHTLSGVTRLSLVVEDTETDDESLTIGAGLVRLSRVDAPPPSASSEAVDEDVPASLGADDVAVAAVAADLTDGEPEPVAQPEADVTPEMEEAPDPEVAPEVAPEVESEPEDDSDLEVAGVAVGTVGAGAIAGAALGLPEEGDETDDEQSEVESAPSAEPAQDESEDESENDDDDADDDSHDDDSHDDDSHDDDSHDDDSHDDDSHDDDSHDEVVAFEDAPTGEQPLVADETPEVAPEEGEDDVDAEALAPEAHADAAESSEPELDSSDTDSPEPVVPEEGEPEGDVPEVAETAEEEPEGDEPPVAESVALAAAAATDGPTEVIGQPEPDPEQSGESTPAFGEPGSSVARISFSTGEQLEVFGPIVIGRAPDASKAQADNPTLVAVPSPSHEISSTHLDIRPGTGIDLGLAVATDLNSTNGSIVMHPGLGPRTLRPGVPEPLFPGTVIDLGDGLTIQIGTPQH